MADIWEKFAFLAAGASLTCLMRASVADIVASPEGIRVARQLIGECAAIAKAAGYPVREKATTFTEQMLLAPDSQFKASMLRDIEGRRRIEAEHLIGDMLQRGRVLRQPVDALDIAFAQLLAYERARRPTA